MKVYHYILLFVLFFGLFLTLFFVINSLFAQTREYKPLILEDKSSEVYTNSSQFYPNMRYPNRKISFNVSNDCSPKKQDDITMAFSILSQKTILTFQQIRGNAEIEFACSNVAPRPEDKDHFIAGEGGPKDIIDTGLFYVISSGKVSLYREDKCEEPKIAIHEILHALGFDHNNNPESILFPVTSCDEYIDDYIIEQINDLYAADSLPDLAILKANAQKKGRYLNFKTDVINRGLDSASNVTLGIYVDDVLIKSFDLGNIKIGIKKIIEVENLKIPASSDQIEFYVEANGKELYSDNNQVVLNIVE